MKKKRHFASFFHNCFFSTVLRVCNLVPALWTFWESLKPKRQDHECQLPYPVVRAVSSLCQKFIFFFSYLRNHQSVFNKEIFQWRLKEAFLGIQPRNVPSSKQLSQIASAMDFFVCNIPRPSWTLCTQSHSCCTFTKALKGKDTGLLNFIHNPLRVHNRPSIKIWYVNTCLKEADCLAISEKPNHVLNLGFLQRGSSPIPLQPAPLSDALHICLETLMAKVRLHHHRSQRTL